MTEIEPDIAALATRLGVRKLNYRTFVRPSFPEPVSTVPDEPEEAPPAPAVVALPEPPVPVRPLHPLTPPPAIGAAMPLPMPMPMPAAAQPATFPLLTQALSYRTPPAGTTEPASAQPFLNLRHVIAETSRQAEH